MTKGISASCCGWSAQGKQWYFEKFEIRSMRANITLALNAVGRDEISSGSSAPSPASAAASLPTAVVLQVREKQMTH
jgi:hypothetical protein